MFGIEEGNRNPECGIKGEETADENKSEVPDLNQYLTSDRSVEQGQEMFQQEQTEGKSGNTVPGDKIGMFKLVDCGFIHPFAV